MKKILFIVILFCLLVPAKSQEIDDRAMRRELLEEETRRGKFYIIPETTFWFGTYTSIDVSPQVGYHLTDRWSAGPGLHYIYYRNIDYFSPETWSTHLYGIKVFSRFDIIRNAEEFMPFYLFSDLFVHAEYEALSLDSRYFSSAGLSGEGRFWMSNVFLGLGITQRMGGYNGYSIMLLWNLNDSYYSPYSNPTYRVGLLLYL